MGSSFTTERYSQYAIFMRSWKLQYRNFSFGKSSFVKLMKGTELHSITKIFWSDSCLYSDITFVGRKMVLLLYDCCSLERTDNQYYQLLVVKATTVKYIIRKRLRSIFRQNFIAIESSHELLCGTVLKKESIQKNGVGMSQITRTTHKLWYDIPAQKTASHYNANARVMASPVHQFLEWANKMDIYIYSCFSETFLKLKEIFKL